LAACAAFSVVGPAHRQAPDFLILPAGQELFMHVVAFIEDETCYA
jgi:hypothetical protein